MPDIAASIDALATALTAERADIDRAKAEAAARDKALADSLAKLAETVAGMKTDDATREPHPAPKPAPAPPPKAVLLPALLGVWAVLRAIPWTTLLSLAVMLGELWIHHGPPLPIPTPTPTPIPVPPTPVPPTPLGPLRVILAFDSTANMTAGQIEALSSTDVRGWLNQHCGKDGAGRPAWRSWDKTVDVSGEPKDWQDAWSAAKPMLGTLPQVIVFVGQKGTAYPLPDSADGLTALLAKAVP